MAGSQVSLAMGELLEREPPTDRCGPSTPMVDQAIPTMNYPAQEAQR
jgi:hypothetical protein